MKSITDDEEQNWLQDNTKFNIFKSFICACAAIFMNLIRYGYNNCSKTKTKSGISDLRKDNGSLTSTDLEKAEVLNRFFISIFTQENTETMPEVESFSKGIPLEYIEITSNMVFKKLSALNPSKSPGQDGLHPRVLKELKDVIALPLSIIFNISINEGELPLDWKISQVSPIFKKGDRKEAGNYRPVSLTSVCCKMMESIIRDRDFFRVSQGPK